MDFITVNTWMKYCVITTFNAAGYKSYGSRMIDTFLTTWPKDVTLIVYAEDCAVSQTAENLQIRDLHQASPELVEFKKQWTDVPKANGNFGAQSRGKEFKYQAVRFAHKVYAIFHAARTAQSKWLIWMDADMVCHTVITPTELDKFFPDWADLCFAGRTRKFSECGLYGMHLEHKIVHDWLQEFQRMYDQAETGIFTLEEWHDSFVFDAVRNKFHLKESNWTGHLNISEGHPLINSAWGAYIDHLKGQRKNYGRSLRSDLKVSRPESYWQ